MVAPNNNKGMTYQTDEKHLTVFPEYLVGVVKLAINCYNNCFLLSVFTNIRSPRKDWVKLDLSNNTVYE